MLQNEQMARTSGITKIHLRHTKGCPFWVIFVRLPNGYIPPKWGGGGGKKAFSPFPAIITIKFSLLKRSYWKVSLPGSRKLNMWGYFPPKQ